MTRSTLASPLAFLLLVGLAACNTNYGRQLHRTNMDSANPTLSAGAPTVDVALSEYSIAMPEAVKAGPIDFRVSNDGSVPHSLAVEGGAVNREMETEVEPGATRLMMVNLLPGTYTITSPVDNDVERGMKRQLVVR